MTVELRGAVDLICLLYHEARNVRHPIRAGKIVDATKFQRLINLPTNREDAWRQMNILRNDAANSGVIGPACEIFERAFGLTVDDLVALYQMPIWRASAYGGNKWAEISLQVRVLVEHLTNGCDFHAGELYQQILSMAHNTGRVGDKLARLNS